jgi:multicomponent K+:H+ antiporter subunit A
VLLIIILLPLLLGSTWVWLAAKHSRGLTALSAGSISLLCFALLCSLQPQLSQHQALTQHWDWIPSIGLNLSFRLDALSWMFALLISGIGSLIICYSYYYLSPKNSLAKLYSILMLFMAAMLGIALSNNLLLLLIFWELTSLSSFLLVGYWQHYEAAQRGARMALCITGLGGLSLLAGVVLLGQISGSYQIDTLLSQRAVIQSSPYFVPMLLLILVGALSKSAQFPFHFWLPNAMAAPTPVSAYLHSATMVKAGIFLLLRLLPILVGAGVFHVLVTAVGLITFVIGAFFAIFKQDLKGLLAYSTISHLGLIMTLIGIGSPLAIAAAVFHLLNHASFKAALFMIAGIIDHQCATRDLRKLSAVWQFLPITGTLAMVCCAAMAGVPLSNGFISKEMFFDVLLRSHSGWWLVLVSSVAGLAGVFAVSYSLRLCHGVFFDAAYGKHPLPNSDIHEPPKAMLAPVLLLASLCLLVGIAPALFAEGIVNAATLASTQNPQIAPVHLALWHGFNLPLLISCIALLGGTLLYALLAQGGRIRRMDIDQQLGLWRGVVLFDLALKHLLLGSRCIKKLSETGSLQHYLFSILCCAIGLVLLPLYGQALGQGTRQLHYAPLEAIVLWLILLCACWMMLWFHHERIKAVLISGAVGLVVTMLFVGLSAPDLALTQISVDAVTTVLLLMSLALLPQLSPYESKRTQRWRDAIIALVSGLGLGWLTWLVLSSEHQSISWFFLQQALPLGGGANVVNVILVDFRGFDTFGEISVLGIAALGILSLMDGMRAHGTRITPGLSYRFTPSPLLMRTTMSWVLPLALVVSVYIFLRGHNQPGGGFIAGLITAMALIIQYMALGQDEAERRLKAAAGRLYELWIALGLCIAGLTGIAAWAWQRPFLTSAHAHVSPIILGELHLTSAAVFDLGVYITVVGATMLIISVLGDSRYSTLSGPIAEKKP